jgi:hypothetical protein
MSKHPKETGQQNGRLKKIVESFPKVTVTVPAIWWPTNLSSAKSARLTGSSSSDPEASRTNCCARGGKRSPNLADLASMCLPWRRGERRNGSLAAQGIPPQHVPVARPKDKAVPL